MSEFFPDVVKNVVVRAVEVRIMESVLSRTNNAMKTDEAP
jgi:hypothetical protein